MLPVLNIPTISRQRHGRATATIVSPHNRASSEAEAHPARILHVSCTYPAGSVMSPCERPRRSRHRQPRTFLFAILIALCLTFDMPRVAFPTRPSSSLHFSFFYHRFTSWIYSSISDTFVGASSVRFTASCEPGEFIKTLPRR